MGNGETGGVGMGEDGWGRGYRAMNREWGRLVAGQVMVSMFLGKGVLKGKRNAMKVDVTREIKVEK